jgi:hypothetical protein
MSDAIESRRRTGPTEARRAGSGAMTHSLRINGERIEPGSRVTLELPIAQLYTHAPMNMSVHVICGARDGPRLFLSAAIHGDELNGVEIIRRILHHPALKRIRGSLIAVPIVNVYGVLQQSRYLPDRRDLNRSFPGSERGSLAARLADLFMREIVAQATHGIDLHTGAAHRENFPQIRANLDDAATNDLAREFGVPVLLNSTLRDGSLREAASERGIPILLYEAGEALRFDEMAIRVGVKGVTNIMRALGMLPKARKRRPAPEPFVARSSLWVRAPESGILRPLCALGTRVRKGQRLGEIADPFGDAMAGVTAPSSGIVIGRLNLPLVHEGDALFHIARFEHVVEVAQRVETFQTVHTEIDNPDGEPPIL